MQNSILRTAKKQQQEEELSRIIEFICQYKFKEAQLLYLCPEIRSLTHLQQNPEKISEQYRREVQALAELNDLDKIYEEERKEKFKEISKDYEEKMKQFQEKSAHKKTGFSLIGKIFGGKKEEKSSENLKKPVKQSIYQSPLKTIAYIPKQNSIRMSKLSTSNKPQSASDDSAQKQTKTKIIHPSRAPDNEKRGKLREAMNRSLPPKPKIEHNNDIDRILVSQSNSHISGKDGLDGEREIVVAQTLTEQPVREDEIDKEASEKNEDSFSQQDFPSYHSTVRPISQLQSIAEQSSCSDLVSYSSSLSNPYARTSNSRQPNIQETSQQPNPIKNRQRIEYNQLMEESSRKISQRERSILGISHNGEVMSEYSDIQIDWMMKLEAYELQQKLITNRIYQRLNKPPNIFRKMQNIKFKDYTRDIESRVKIDKKVLNFGKIIQWQR